jgi:hypothetical protein
MSVESHKTVFDCPNIDFSVKDFDGNEDVICT